MNKGMLAVGIIFLALLAFATINLIQDFSTGQELDYYLLKETTDAAMVDALDFDFYAESGSIRMDKEKFVESFLRRFAKAAEAKDYDIYFYALNETPPKASVKIDAKTVANGAEGDKLDITTTYNSILETKYLQDTMSKWKIATGELDANVTTR